MMLHALENTNIPYNSRQWDAPAGTAADHKRRMLSNHKEGVALILISCIFNLLHLLPLSILGMIQNVIINNMHLRFLNIVSIVIVMLNKNLDAYQEIPFCFFG